MKRLTGTVLSDKMEKTIVVKVEYLFTHPRYGKKIRRIKKFYAHDELGAKKEDRVVIEEGRPLSKLKRWRVVEIMNAK